MHVLLRWDGGVAEHGRKERDHFSDEFVEVERLPHHSPQDVEAVRPRQHQVENHAITGTGREAAQRPVPPTAY